MQSLLKRPQLARAPAKGRGKLNDEKKLFTITSGRAWCFNVAGEFREAYSLGRFVAESFA